MQVGGEIFSVGGVGGDKFVMKGLSFMDVASKAAHVLLVMDLLPMYGKSYYPSITITSLDSNKTQIYNSWKEKLGSITIPQVECVKCFIYSDTQGIAKPSTICNSIANAITFSSTDDSDDLRYLVDQPTNVDSLIPVLKRIWGYDCFKHEQYDALKAILEGEDVFVQMPTGGGKSLIFQIIAAVSSGLVVCVSPLKSLIKDQTQACYEKNINACFLFGTMDNSQKESIYYSLKQPVCPFQIMYTTPECITQDTILLQVLNSLYARQKLKLFAIDEVHCVSQWGHEFRSAYLNLDIIRKSFRNVPIVMLTASATKHTRDDCISILGIDNPKIITSSVCRSNLVYGVKQKSSKSVDYIADMIKPLECSIVYCSTIKECENICPKLETLGVKCKVYHGQLEDNIRNQRQEMWVNNTLQCLICTSSFGLGVNKPNVRAVVHYSFPSSLEAYMQETGRGGRDGLLAQCLLFFTPQNQIFHLKNISSMRKYDSINADRKQLSFLNMLHWCFQNVECRRSLILKYFDETVITNCSVCDICKRNNTVVESDITDVAKKVILCVQRTSTTPEKKNFTLNYFAKIITGKKVKHEHDKYPEYGIIPGSTEYGEYLLRILVYKEILMEQPPSATSRNQNTVYLTLGPKYLEVLSGHTNIKCTLKTQHNNTV